MRCLLDTCVLSELNRAGGSESVREAVAGLSDDEAWLSVVSIGEIVKGVTLLDAGARQRQLRAWLDRLQTHYADRLLPIDVEIADIWGETTARARREGRTVHMADGLIAATALRHGLQVMTRNTSDFEPFGVRITNPW